MEALKGTGSLLRLESLFNIGNVLSICANLSFQTEGKAHVFMELALARILVFL